jgi:farnesyl diphosphate synthase
LRNYGMALGLAFQIMDDILDEVGDPATMGKPQGSDLARQKATYPALFGLDASRAKAEALRDEALGALSHLPGERRLLQVLAEFTISRTS